MRYVSTEKDSVFEAYITALDESHVPPIERTIWLTREDIGDILRSLGGDPCAHIVDKSLKGCV